MLLYFKISYLIGGIAPLVIGLLVLLKNNKSIINRTFFFISLCGTIWSLGLFLMLSSKNFVIAHTWRLLMDFGSIMLPAFWIHFVFSFLNINKKRKKELIIYYLVSFILSFLNLLDLFIPGVFLKDLSNKYLFSYYPTGGFGYFLLFIFYLILVPYSLFILVRFYLKSKGIKTLQLRYIIFAAFLGFIGGGMSFLLTFNINFPPYGIIFFSLYPVIIGYAIARYRLMDVRLVVFRSLAFGLIVFIIGGIFAAISTLVTSLFADLVGIKSNIISGIIVATLLTIFYQPLRRLIEKTTNTFLYKKSYNPDILLNQITEVASSILDLKNLLTSIAKTLDEAFHTQKIGIALVNNDANKLHVAYQDGFKEGTAEQLAAYPNAVETLYKEVKRLGGILVIDEMKTKYENGEFEPVDKELLLALYQNDIAIILPLHVKEQVIGIVALGNKKSGDPYNSQDLNILRIIAGQVAIAIENARLYDELKDFNIKLEEEVRRKTAQLRRANAELKKLDEAKSEFISIASHQLRTPLTVIKGYISMMQEGSFGEVPPKIMENLSKVYVSNERLISLVENLLDISRIESGRQEFLWEQVSLEEIALGVVDNLQQAAKGKNLKLILHKNKAVIPRVLADKNKIHEVMMNFVDNAIKYTPQGQVDIYLKDSPSGFVTFCVKDSGPGIDPEIKANLFKKFSRGKESFRVHTEGVGLGLYVAKMIIDAHSGKIWAESEGRDKGSMFCFSIPLDHKPKETAPKFGTKMR